jgi:preprotein translocase subunit SecA
MKTELDGVAAGGLYVLGTERHESRRIGARPAVKRALKVGADWSKPVVQGSMDEEARKILFGQRARVA